MLHKWIKKFPVMMAPAKSLILEAIIEVNKGHSIRQVAKSFRLSKSAVQHHLQKYSQADDKESIVFQCNLVCGLVFSEDLDSALVEKLKEEGRGVEVGF